MNLCFLFDIKYDGCPFLIIILGKQHKKSTTMDIKDEVVYAVIDKIIGKTGKLRSI